MAVTGVIGLAIASAAARVLSILDSRVGDSGSGLMTAAWVADAVCAVVAIAYRLVAPVLWAVYWWRHAELDTERAEVVGEINAWIANRHRDP
jgi:Mg2+/Co2+ transporter CorB